MWLLDSESDRQIGEHWSLTRAEMEVFNIDPDLAEALEDGLNRFMVAVEHASTDNAGLRQAEQDRKAWPEYKRFVPEPGGSSTFECADAVEFMVAVCGLPRDQAVGWYWRYDARCLRDGLFMFPDDEVSAKYNALRKRRLPLLQGAVAVSKEPPF